VYGNSNLIACRCITLSGLLKTTPTPFPKIGHAPTNDFLQNPVKEFSSLLKSFDYSKSSTT
jgi:hypothetical protein